MAAKFRNAGQACTAANRFLVHQSVVDEFVAKLVPAVASLSVGPPTSGADMGPLISHRAVSAMDELVEDALAHGAVLAYQASLAEQAGSFFAPTILTDVPAAARVMNEEIFGPIVAVSTWTSESEVLATPAGCAWPSIRSPGPVRTP